jgi:hypothetical protein
MTARALLTRVLLTLLAVELAACVDVRSFAGTWSGAIIADEPVRQGFAADARVESLLLANVDLRSVTASLSTNDGRFHDSTLVPVHKAASDSLATLTFDGSPLRSYLFFSPTLNEAQAGPAWELVSLFSDDHVELRVIRGNDLFGVFQLYRAP